MDVRRILASVAFMMLSLPAYSQTIDSQPKPQNANTNPWAEINIGGYYADPRIGGGYAGVTYSPNNDIWSEGVLLRFSGGSGKYPSSSGAVSFSDAGAMIGYRFTGDQGDNMAVYVGPSLSFTDQPDEKGFPSGAEWGAKTVIDFTKSIGGGLNFDGYGSIASTRAQYFTQFHVTGHMAPEWRTGPELGVLGGTTFRQYRAGGVMSYDPGSFNITLNGGREIDRQGSNFGYYLGAGTSWRFR